MGENLQMHIERVDDICCLIENEDEYLGVLTGYLPLLNQVISYILASVQNPEVSFTINEQFVVQVLQDILYGMEHQDDVFLLDTLRYGLLEIYKYAGEELQSEEIV